MVPEKYHHDNLPSSKVQSKWEGIVTPLGVWATAYAWERTQVEQGRLASLQIANKQHAADSRAEMVPFLDDVLDRPHRRIG